MAEGLKKMEKEITSENQDLKRYIWCLVGNIIEEGNYLKGNKMISFNGTNHFKAGTKVYCSPFIWGDGYERIRVIGRAKDTNKYISIIMEAYYIIRWRAQKVYTPYILRRNQDERDKWDNTLESKQLIDEMLKWLPDRTLKKPEDF